MNATEPISMNYRIGILVIGELPFFSLLSLQSMAKVGFGNVCYVSDQKGDEWLRTSASEVKGIHFCKHENSKILDEISRLGLEGGYVSFGNSKFFLLMILKWLLIIDMMAVHATSKYVLYSDLDVIWRQRPSADDIFMSRSEATLAIQDDSTFDGRTYFCPGIMFWRNSGESKELIKAIFEFQKKEIENGTDMPDDKALNYVIQSEDLFQKVIPLDKKTFIIGHRFPYLMGGINGFRLRKFVAFHANYVSGSQLKYRYMRGALNRPFNPLRIFYLINFICHRISRKK